MIYLDPREYAKIVSEINTIYDRYKGKRYAQHLSYGIDDIAYVYTFQNHGFNDYTIIGRDEIE